MDGRHLAPLVLAVMMAALTRPALAEGRPTLTAAELRCLATNVYWEARGEPDEGQAAVAHVTLNRARSPDYPRSVCAVVHQANQFGWTIGNHVRPLPAGQAWEKAMAVARQAASGGGDPTGGALFFHHLREKPDFARGRYANKRVIGQHVFFNLKQDTPIQVAQLDP